MNLTVRNQGEKCLTHNGFKKYLGINRMEDVKDFFTKQFKTLKKEVEDTRR